MLQYEYDLMKNGIGMSNGEMYQLASPTLLTGGNVQMSSSANSPPSARSANLFFSLSTGSDVGCGPMSPQLQLPQLVGEKNNFKMQFQQAPLQQLIQQKFHSIAQQQQAHPPNFMYSLSSPSSVSISSSNYSCPSSASSSVPVSPISPQYLSPHSLSPPTPVHLNAPMNPICESCVTYPNSGSSSPSLVDSSMHHHHHHVPQSCDSCRVRTTSSGLVCMTNGALPHTTSEINIQQPHNHLPNYQHQQSYNSYHQSQPQHGTPLSAHATLFHTTSTPNVIHLPTNNTKLVSFCVLICLFVCVLAFISSFQKLKLLFVLV